MYIPSLVPTEIQLKLRKIAQDDLTLAFLDYILFKPWKDKESGRTICSAAVIHSLDGTEDLIRQRRTQVQDRLEHFRTTLDPEVTLRIHPQSMVTGQATSVTAKFNAELEQFRKLRRQALRAGTPMVRLNTGKPMTVRERKQLRERYYHLAHEAVREAARNGHPLAAELKYLNELPPNYYARLRKRLDDLTVSVQRLPSRALEVNAGIVDTLRIEPQPLYKSVANSPRLYTLGLGLQNMTGRIRDQLFIDSYSLDLEAAQLGIVTTLWNIPAVREAVAEHGGTWAALLHDTQALGLQKQQLKSILYPVVFGMSDYSLNKLIRKEAKMSREQFFNASPLFQAILEARAARMERIRVEEGITDAFGLRQPLKRLTSGEEGVEKMRRDRAVRSLLAYEAQSYEARIMQNALQFIIENQRYVKITLLIHDGMYIQFTRETKEGQKVRLLNALRDEVAGAARQCDISTRLVGEYIDVSGCKTNLKDVGIYEN